MYGLGYMVCGSTPGLMLKFHFTTRCSSKVDSTLETGQKQVMGIGALFRRYNSCTTKHFERERVCMQIALMTWRGLNLEP